MAKGTRKKTSKIECSVGSIEQVMTEARLIKAKDEIGILQPKIKVFNASTNELPKYETPDSTCMDIRVDFTREEAVDALKDLGIRFSINDGELGFYFKPNARVLIPTGLVMAIPEGYGVSLRPRSGLAYAGIMVANSPGTIDADYRDEVKVILVNNGDETVFINNGFRCGQMLIEKVTQFEWDEVDSIEALGKTYRKGGIGHTGTK